MRSTALSLVGLKKNKKLWALLKPCDSEVLPVQEVVFVKVSDAGSNFTGHPLQLQQLSVSEHPILLRQITPQIPLQNTHRQTHRCIGIKRKHSINRQESVFVCVTAIGGILTSGSSWTAMWGVHHTGAVDSPVTVSSALLTADVWQDQIRVTPFNGPLCCVTEIYK